ncbi:MAG: TIM barrel protein, partial [Candidatus Hydrogenedentales bacterium]
AVKKARAAGASPADKRAAAKTVFAKNLEAAADKATRYGLSILLEPLNPRDAPGYFYSTVEEAADMIAVVGRPNIRIMFDCYHVGVTQQDVLKRLERHLPLIGHVQIAAVPSRAEPDEGEIAYGAIFKMLDALGYAGWIGCEYKPRGDTDAGLGWMRRLGIDRPSRRD